MGDNEEPKIGIKFGHTIVKELYCFENEFSNAQKRFAMQPWHTRSTRIDVTRICLQLCTGAYTKSWTENTSIGISC